MSRVHDALRRAGQSGYKPEELPPLPEQPHSQDVVPATAGTGGGNGSFSAAAAAAAPNGANGALINGRIAAPVRANLLPAMLAEVTVTPFQPAPESHLLDLNHAHETPAEEFRTLRTRLNHLQTI